MLLPGLLLTFTRLVEPHGGRWIRLESFTPYGMPLYLIALLLLAVAAFRWAAPVDDRARRWSRLPGSALHVLVVRRRW